MSGGEEGEEAEAQEAQSVHGATVSWSGRSDSYVLSSHLSEEERSDVEVEEDQAKEEASAVASFVYATQQSQAKLGICGEIREHNRRAVPGGTALFIFWIVTKHLAMTKEKVINFFSRAEHCNSAQTIHTKIENKISQ